MIKVMFERLKRLGRCLIKCSLEICGIPVTNLSAALAKIENVA